MNEEFLGGYTKPWLDSIKRNRMLVRRYNEIEPDRIWDKYQILKELLGQVDEKVIIEPPFFCDDGSNIFVGKQFYANYNFTVLDAGRVTIGDYVAVGPNVTICAVSHPLHHKSRVKDGFPIIHKPVTIGNNVWIGAGAIICMGVTIGDNAVIGAGSVVTRDIPPDVLAAGSPCRVVRPITDDDLYEWSEEERIKYGF